MNCIIVDDEPIARRGIEKLVKSIDHLNLIGSCENAAAASALMLNSKVDLIFLDIQMPGINGLEFAKQIGKTTLVIFTTAFSEFALNSYEVDAIDYLLKPVHPDRFQKAVEKAVNYHKMLLDEEHNTMVERSESDSIFVKSNRRYFKVIFKEILFVEGLKDYVVIQTEKQKLITHINLKNAHQLLPSDNFLRVNRSYIVNKDKIDSFSNNDVYIGQYEISIGNFYREGFLEEVMKD